MRIAKNHKTLRQILREEVSSQIACGQLPAGAKLPTMAEFARQHDVSLATAKRVFNDLAAAGLIDCRRGARAVVTGLNKGHGKVVFLIHAFIDAIYDNGPWSMSWQQQVALACEQRNITLIPVDYKVLDNPQLLSAADGVIICEVFPKRGDHLAQLRKMDLPFAALKNRLPEAGEQNIASIDYRRFFSKCVTYIHSCGIRRINYIAGDSDPPSDRLDVPGTRQNLLLNAILEQGGSHGDLHVYCAGSVFGLNRESYLFMDEVSEPFAVISSGYWTGRETLRLCQEKQLTPKQDFVLIDGSGLPESEAMQMSSLKIDFKYIGGTLVKMLERQWANNCNVAGNELINTSLTIRNS